MLIMEQHRGGLSTGFVVKTLAFLWDQCQYWGIFNSNADQLMAWKHSKSSSSFKPSFESEMHLCCAVVLHFILQDILIWAKNCCDLVKQKNKWNHQATLHQTQIILLKLCEICVFADEIRIWFIDFHGTCMKWKLTQAIGIYHPFLIWFQNTVSCSEERHIPGSRRAESCRTLNGIFSWLWFRPSNWGTLDFCLPEDLFSAQNTDVHSLNHVWVTQRQQCFLLQAGRKCCFLLL